MNATERETKAEIGMPIFLQFYGMKRPAIIAKVISIIDGNEKIEADFFVDCCVTKTERDDEPHSVNIYNYAAHSQISISPLGIVYKPRYSPGLNLADFNHHFVL